MRLSKDDIAKLVKAGATLGPAVKPLCNKVVKAVASAPWEGRLALFIPGLVVKSEANLREHYMSKHRRKTGQQTVVANWLLGRGKPPLDVRLSVGFLREYSDHPQQAMDEDNLTGSFKHVQDALAKWLGRDDGDGTIDWRYEQLRSERSGVGISIEEAT